MRYYKKFRRARGGFSPAIPRNYGSGNSDFYNRVTKIYRTADGYAKKYTGKSIKRHASNYVHGLMNRMNQEGKKNYVQTKKKRTTRIPPPPSSKLPPLYSPGSPWSPRGKAKLNQRVRPVGVGSSFSKFSYYHRANWIKKVYKQLSPFQKYSVLSSSRIQVNQNLISTLYTACYTKAHLVNMCALVESDGGSITPSAYPEAGFRFILHSCRQELMFTNQTNATMFLKLYEYTCRRETGIAPDDAYKKGFEYEQSVASSATAGRDVLYGALTIGATPFQSSFFCTRYKINRVYTLELASGKSHVHVSYYSPNKWYSQEDVDSPVTAETDTFQAYLTRGTFIQAYGSPVDDDASSVAIGRGAIDMVTRMTYTFRHLKPQKISYVYTDTLPTVVTEHVMSEEGLDQSTTTA